MSPGDYRSRHPRLAHDPDVEDRRGQREGDKMAAPPPPALREMEAPAAGSLRQCAALLGPGIEPGRRLQALLALRTKHLKEAGAAERFGRAGGVRALVELLLLHRERCRLQRKELEVGLSILANCCTQEAARRQIRILGGIAPLVNILKEFSVLSVQNRAARALGNLALEPENSVIIHQSGAVPHLIGLLTNVEDAECLQTVVRTLRILSDSPAHRRLLTAQGCVSPLLALLGREESGLLGAAARATAELSRSCGAPCALQISRHGGIPRLASLAVHGERAVREGALAALGNLCGQGFVRPSVGGAGGIGLLVGALRSDPGSSSAPAHLRALCLCCREAVNRARVREEGGLDLLLALLKEPGHRASHSRIIGALLGFFYDQHAMDYLHARGLVPVLLDKLVALAGLRQAAPPHLVHCSSPPEEPEDERQAASFDYPPERPIDGEELPHEASSSFLSLRSWLVSEGYIESPEEVLPVPLSETEASHPLLQSPGELIEAEPLEPAAADRLGGALLPAAPRPLPVLPLSPTSPPPPHEPCLPEAPVLLLLSRFSQAEDPTSGLVTERSLRTLLDYLTLARPPGARCARLLARLACNPNCLEALVRARAVPLVRAQLIHGLRPVLLPESVESPRGHGGDWTATRRNRELGEVLLRNLSVQAESPFGTGALTHLLLSGSPSDREACAIALPLLCRNESLRRRLLLDHGGLHLLLETLLTSQEPVASFGAADGVAWLAGALGKGPAPQRARLAEEGGEASPRCLYRELVGRGAVDMWLVLDGGERLAASRAHLSRGSEVFGAMLGGGYLESRQTEVPLGGVEADVADLLLHHLHGCRAQAGCCSLGRLGQRGEEEGEPFEESLLGRALSAAGQFLLGDLVPCLEQAAYLSCVPSCLPALCLFAERHHLPGLHARCLCGLLEAPMGARDRVEAWRKLAGGAGDRVGLLSALRALLLKHV